MKPYQSRMSAINDKRLIKDKHKEKFLFLNM